ncbi:peptidylprolyl isomerase [Neisseria meningitidis]|uniref:Peptidyl-prolyl cis-trans isomerase n=12 Tax=Neisseria meningitidis TaxID=487 RepID=A0A425B5S9_NEIME|nr:peptidylprolyl isomerase [Neisseria meningitidis]RQK81879.1 peptidylprolyl isomerase [Neisseria meningitidis]
MKPKFKTVLTALLLAVSLPSMAATHVLMETDMGNIRLVLDESKAPKTVANFVRYARKGFYDDTVFHRVIDGFVIQGGGFTEDLVQKATDKAVANESGNGLKNTAGTIAMARTADPDSATSQFFINLADNASLDYKNGQYGYTVFGRVESGMDTVSKIARVKTATRGFYQNVPVQPVKIRRVVVGQLSLIPLSAPP